MEEIEPSFNPVQDYLNDEYEVDGEEAVDEDVIVDDGNDEQKDEEGSYTVWILSMAENYFANELLWFTYWDFMNWAN